MPVLPLKSMESLSPEMQQLVKVFDEWLGDTVYARFMAHNPPLFLKFNEFYDFLLNRGTVEPQIKELARLRLARNNDCHY
jgi:alkylhydroperoxidase family enzyme